MLFGWPSIRVCICIYDALYLMNAAGVKCFCSSLPEIECDVMMFHSVMCHLFSLSRPWGAFFFTYRWLSLRMILFKIGFECVLLKQWLTSSKSGIRIVDGYALLKDILWLSHVGPLLNVADLFWLWPRGSGLLNKALGEEWASRTAFAEQDKLAGITWSKK